MCVMAYFPKQLALLSGRCVRPIKMCLFPHPEENAFVSEATQQLRHTKYHHQYHRPVATQNNHIERHNNAQKSIIWFAYVERVRNMIKFFIGTQHHAVLMFPSWETEIHTREKKCDIVRRQKKSIIDSLLFYWLFKMKYFFSSHSQQSTFNFFFMPWNSNLPAYIFLQKMLHVDKSLTIIFLLFSFQ